jgi:hypothetical protein
MAIIFAPPAHEGGVHRQEWHGIALLFRNYDDYAYSALVNSLYRAS